jgi:hypothetical protein
LKSPTISANALKLGCSGEDEGAWDMARPAHNINMAAIKNKVENIFEETASVFLYHSADRPFKTE